ncbi:hypothetical protein [Sporanaerobacter acetigenes]|uniref:hypothetical protein n=1 Tax=Sporanaerobacter acetigenes TaxID=165813 RepID=UPI001047CE89|nr:hypothetical protein [Sporanaerobacter acetigenes]
MKSIKRTFGGVKEILKTRNFEGISVMVDDEGIVADNTGKKIVPAGTILGGKTGSLLGTDTEVAVEKNTVDAEGVLLYDVDVTNGPEPASMVIRGNIDLNKIPTAPTTEAKGALKSRILFIK